MLPSLSPTCKKRRNPKLASLEGRTSRPLEAIGQQFSKGKSGRTYLKPVNRESVPGRLGKLSRAGRPESKLVNDSSTSEAGSGSVKEVAKSDPLNSTASKIPGKVRVLENDSTCMSKIDTKTDANRGVFYLCVMRVKIDSELLDDKGAYVIVNCKSPMGIKSYKTPVISDVKRQTWNTLPSALRGMRQGDVENLASCRPENAEFQVWSEVNCTKERNLFARGSLAFDSYDDKFACSNPGVQCKWVKLENGLGSLRVCYYFGPNGEAPSQEMEQKLKSVQSPRSNSSRSRGIKSDVLQLSVFVGTWNLNSKDPSASQLAQFLSAGQHDLYMISAQECGHMYSSLLINYTAAWEEKLKQIFKEQYDMVGSEFLHAIHGIVFIKKSLARHVTQFEASYAATGVGNMIGNKGGVGISFNVGKTSFAFIASHFHAFVSGVELRNADYHAIEKRLTMRKTKDSAHYTSKRFDRVFWAGDLNYRCLLNRSITETLLRDDKLAPLLLNEQLMQQMKLKNVFEGYTEAKITFRPTYKFDNGTDVYDTSEKKRVPSWTDRILWKQDDQNIQCLKYNSVPKIRVSDHKPVSAVFQVKCELKSLKKAGVRNGNIVDGSTACVLQ
mmetsp:Transcript_16228/g.29175  ORF Transcript_16228/g.29175 Transcript_16228/m.29175 type:complete len:612 (-) Transcript_16228:273-2108(-)|eukprot:CAMPEP_0197528856 /NCGR_PEP_ID=MMETSP1318-20131121/26551_1 /TAXON_ID=552666 /ORGANISM="Partenskyella glossopodia, Strain RCC365" /LENGTH=611 /DNA_ID=CAMNT_0043084123 /DNA_START=135 /DNA_END=1970 /DNA_ORIENTATION=-